MKTPTAILSLLTLVVACAAQLQAQPQPAAPDCNIGRVEFPQVDPRHPAMHCLEPYGFMRGWLTTCVNAAKSEGFGSRVVPLGDINHDQLADFAIERTRCDTGFYYGTPIDWYVYHGVRGGLPDSRSGQRLGPTEVASQTTVLCAGDWDGDGNTDIAATFTIIGDTLGGDTIHYGTSRVCVFWGNALGTYSIDDTTRLVAYSDIWLAAFRAVSTDLDGDDIADLAVWGGGSLSGGHQIPTAKLHIYRGHPGSRWGRSGVSHNADLEWWYVPPFNFLRATDQDCDGNSDIALFNQVRDMTGYATVLYGRKGALPDTNAAEAVDVAVANGHRCMLVDVTGDRVPELVMNAGSQEVLKVFAGHPGQRLREQYGTGNESGKPWLVVDLPKKVNPHDWFSTGFEELYDLGDGNLDGIDDIWTYSFPFFVCYTTGETFDQFIDAGMRWTVITSATRLGDIDGSGRATFTVGFTGTPGGLSFYKATDSFPTSGVEVKLPHAAEFRCTNSATVPTATQESREGITIAVVPNPARESINVHWEKQGDHARTTLSLVDESGATRYRQVYPTNHTDAAIPTTGLAAGTYLVVVACGNSSTATKVIIP